jgi:bifunctional non-homologous end joining protein LigD
MALLGLPAATPGFIDPCIATRADKSPVGPDGVHEIKHDGYRMIVQKKDGGARLFSRRGYDSTDRFLLIREAVTKLRPSAAVRASDGVAAKCRRNLRLK